MFCIERDIGTPCEVGWKNLVYLFPVPLVENEEACGCT